MNMAVFVHDALLFIALVGSAVISVRQGNGRLACAVVFVVLTIAPCTVGIPDYEALGNQFRYVTGEWAFLTALAVSGAIMLRYRPPLPSHRLASLDPPVRALLVISAFVVLALFFVFGLLADWTHTIGEKLALGMLAVIANLLWITYLLRAEAGSVRER